MDKKTKCAIVELARGMSPIEVSKQLDVPLVEVANVLADARVAELEGVPVDAIESAVPSAPPKPTASSSKPTAATKPKRASQSESYEHRVRRAERGAYAQFTGDQTGGPGVRVYGDCAVIPAHPGTGIDILSGGDKREIGRG